MSIFEPITNLIADDHAANVDHSEILFFHEYENGKTLTISADGQALDLNGRIYSFKCEYIEYLIEEGARHEVHDNLTDALQSIHGTNCLLDNIEEAAEIYKQMQEITQKM